MRERVFETGEQCINECVYIESITAKPWMKWFHSYENFHSYKQSWACTNWCIETMCISSVIQTHKHVLTHEHSIRQNRVLPKLSPQIIFWRYLNVNTLIAIWLISSPTVEEEKLHLKFLAHSIVLGNFSFFALFILPFFHWILFDDINISTKYLPTRLTYELVNCDNKIKSKVSFFLQINPRAVNNKSSSLERCGMQSSLHVPSWWRIKMLTKLSVYSTES